MTDDIYECRFTNKIITISDQYFVSINLLMCQVLCNSVSLTFGFDHVVRVYFRITTVWMYNIMYLSF